MGIRPGGSFSRVLIVPHVKKDRIGEMVVTISGWLEKRGVERFLLPEDARALGAELPPPPTERVDQSIDLVVVLGGDGTMLHAVDVLWGNDVPFFGINIGKMGFLTASEVHQVEKSLEELFAGRYWVSERVPVGCTMLSDGADRKARALNEIVIGKLMRERLIHLSTYINGDFFMRYSGDGLIFSSATGSTAYSLSSGGPIVTPDLRCFILTPICPHMLFSRPMVLSIRDVVRVLVEEEPERLLLSVDGREDIELPAEAEVEFYALEDTVKILELEGSSFYKTLRRKFLSPPERGRGPLSSTGAA